MPESTRMLGYSFKSILGQGARLQTLKRFPFLSGSRKSETIANDRNSNEQNPELPGFSFEH
jgi:hypothetical protein